MPNFILNDFFEFYKRNSHSQTAEKITINDKIFVKPCLIVLQGNQTCGKEIISKYLVKKYKTSNNEIKLVVLKGVKETLHLLSDLILTVCRIRANDNPKTIYNKFFRICSKDKNIYNNFVPLLDFLGIRDSKIDYGYNTRKKNKLIIKIFADFIRYLAKTIYLKTFSPLIISIYNAHNAKNESINLFLNILNNISSDVPIICLQTIENENKGIVDKYDNFDNISTKIFKVKKKNEEYVKYLINYLFPKNGDGLNREEIIINSKSSILNAIELFNIYTISNGYVEEALNSSQLLDSKLKLISNDSKIILKFLLFFNGKMGKEFLPFIFPELTIADINLAISDLYKLNFITYSVDDMFISSENIFELLNEKLDNSDFIENNLSTIREISKSFFETNSRKNYCDLANIYEKILPSDKNKIYLDLFEKYDYENKFLDILYIIKLIDLDILDLSEKNKILYKELEAIYELENYTLLSDKIKEYENKKMPFDFSLYLSYFKGLLAFHEKQIQDAEKNFLKSFTIAEEIEDKMVAKVAEEMSFFYVEIGNVSKATKYMSKAIDYYKINENNDKISKLYLDFAELNFNLAKYDKCFDYISMSLLYNKKSKFTISHIFGKINILLGQLHFRKMDFQKSETAFLKSIELFETLIDRETLTEIYYLLAELYNTFGDKTKATEYLQKCINFTSNDFSVKHLNLKSLPSAGIHTTGQITYFITKNQFFSYNLLKSKANCEIGLRICALNGLNKKFIEFVELMGDILFQERQFEVTKRCYLYSLEKYTLYSNNLSKARVMLKLAEIYADMKDYESSEKVLQIFLKDEYKYFIENDNKISYLNIKIKNLITQNKYKEVKVIIMDIQKNNFDLIPITKKVSFFNIYSYYLFLTDDFEEGDIYFNKALEICKQNNLIFEEIKLHLAMSKIFSTLEYKRDSLTSLSKIFKLADKTGSTVLADFIKNLIFEL